MLSRIRAHATFSNVTASLALCVALAGGGYAVGATSSATSVITACVGKKNQMLAAKGGKCAKGQRKLSWNRQGQPGSDASVIGVAAGGDLAGTYPNPTIGPGTIGSSEISDASLGTQDFAVATGTIVADLPNLAANNCNFANASPAGVLVTDHMIVTPTGAGGYGVSGDLIVTGVINSSSAAVEVKVCNPTTSAIEPPNETFKYIVLR